MRLRNLLLSVALFVSAYAAILGIDLGQDFTKAVLVGPGVPFEIVMSADSKRKDVSGIAFKNLGDNEVERIYGSHTSSYCTRFPSSCALNYKPLLGKSLEDPSVKQFLTSHSGVDLVASNNNRSTIAFQIGDHKYPVEELLAMNILNIVERASMLLKEKSPGGYSQINDVAFTIPSYFNLAQRVAIQDAAQLAGLNIVALIDDGLAIAVNYATKTEFAIGKQYHIIYDMGAGSTTATLVSFDKVDEKTPLKIVIEGYSHDESLGGEVFTNAIAEIIEERFLERHSTISTSEFKSSSRAIAKIFQASEKAKLILSANVEAPISIESLFDDIDFKTKVTREEFEEFLTEYSSRITRPILDSLNQSGVQLDEIKSVIYSGGSQRVPFVQNHLLSLIGAESVSKTVNADEAAVFGATLRAVQISKMFKAKEFNITDHSVYDYTVKIDGIDEEINVFPIGSKYDITKEIDLTDAIISNDGLSLNLIENYKSYTRHDTVGLSDLKNKFSFNQSDCHNGVRFVGKFSLTESRIFQFDGLEARCEVEQAILSNNEGGAESKPGLLSKILNSNTGSVKTNVKTTLLPFKTRYLSSRPLGTSSKQELRAHLQLLGSKDNQRKLISEKLNELEAALYSARNYLDNDEILAKGPTSIVEEATATVTEYLEWLDYESEGAKLKVIKERIEKVNSLVSQVREFMESLSVPLNLEDFQKLHQEGVLAINSVQETLLTFSEESLEIAKKFAEMNLDYDEELKKLTKYARSISQEKVENICKKMIKFFEQIKDLVEDSDGFASKSREELFQLNKKAISELAKVNNLKTELKAVHAQRAKELNNAIVRSFRQKQRAAAKKAKEEAETAEKETTQNVEDEHIVHENIQQGEPQTVDIDENLDGNTVRDEL